MSEYELSDFWFAFFMLMLCISQLSFYPVVILNAIYFTKKKKENSKKFKTIIKIVNILEIIIIILFCTSFVGCCAHPVKID